jgi:hypothetical protein
MYDETREQQWKESQYKEQVDAERQVRGSG